MSRSSPALPNDYFPGEKGSFKGFHPHSLFMVEGFDNRLIRVEMQRIRPDF